MPTEHIRNTTIASVAYAALRHGGAPPSLARAQLALPRRVAFELEHCFQRCKWGSPKAQRPAFARHDAHIRAVLKEGGFPALPERRR